MSEDVALLELEAVSYRWPGRSSFALTVETLQMKRGESVLLLGESGSGKSTLLSLICGTIAPDRGTISLLGQDIGALASGDRDQFRADHIGLIFQQFNLLPYARVLDNIVLPLRFASDRRARVRDPRQAARTLCADLGLPADSLDAPAGVLSVGQQQRVAAARALIGAPPLIVADEPTSALDAETQAAFLDLLFRQAAAHNSTVLMVSHDARLSRHFDRVVTMAELSSAAVKV